MSDLTNEINRARTKVAGLRLQLKEAELKVDELYANLPDDYPTFTIASGGAKFGPMIVKVDSVHADASRGPIPATNRSGWVSVHRDSSGKFFPNWGAVKEYYPSAVIQYTP